MEVRGEIRRVYTRIENTDGFMDSQKLLRMYIRIDNKEIPMYYKDFFTLKQQKMIEQLGGCLCIGTTSLRVNTGTSIEDGICYTEVNGKRYYLLDDRKEKGKSSWYIKLSKCTEGQVYHR